MTTTARTLPHACAPRALAEELRTLATLTPTELRQRYAAVFGEASRSGNRQWLLRRIAWRLQALAEGSAAERAIDAVRLRARDLAREADLRTRAPAAPPMAAPGAPIATGTIASPRDGRIPPPGSVIVRRFKGHDYRVTVMPVGFEFDGGHYRSLSAVAHAITGGHWNGMHFFRLGTQDGERTEG